MKTQVAMGYRNSRPGGHLSIGNQDPGATGIHDLVGIGLKLLKAQ
jgi:hypothetical protein